MTCMLFKGGDASALKWVARQVAQCSSSVSDLCYAEALC
jgi:hypothetical protein